jgi:hypothetical protein
VIVSFGMADDYRPASERKVAHLRRIRALQPPVLGSRNGAAKLTEAQVVKIRELRANGERPSVLARRYCVDRGVIWRVLTRRTWRHV